MVIRDWVRRLLYGVVFCVLFSLVFFLLSLLIICFSGFMLSGSCRYTFKKIYDCIDVHRNMKCKESRACMITGEALEDELDCGDTVVLYSGYDPEELYMYFDVDIVYTFDFTTDVMVLQDVVKDSVSFMVRVIDLGFCGLYLTGLDRRIVRMGGCDTVLLYNNTGF